MSQIFLSMQRAGDQDLQLPTQNLLVVPTLQKSRLQGWDEIFPPKMRPLL